MPRRTRHVAAAPDGPLRGGRDPRRRGEEGRGGEDRHAAADIRGPTGAPASATAPRGAGPQGVRERVRSAFASPSAVPHQPFGSEGDRPRVCTSATRRVERAGTGVSANPGLRGPSGPIRRPHVRPLLYPRLGFRGTGYVGSAGGPRVRRRRPPEGSRLRPARSDQAGDEPGCAMRAAGAAVRPGRLRLTAGRGVPARDSRVVEDGVRTLPSGSASPRWPDGVPHRVAPDGGFRAQRARGDGRRRWGSRC